MNHLTGVRSECAAATATEDLLPIAPVDTGDCCANAVRELARTPLRNTFFFFCEDCTANKQTNKQEFTSELHIHVSKQESLKINYKKDK